MNKEYKGLIMKMKTTLLLLTTLLLALPLSGQVEITSGDFAKNGMEYPVAIDTFSDREAPESSAFLNKPWKFKDLEQDRLDTVAFVDPEQTPYADVFSTADMATNLLGLGYGFLNKTRGELRLIGLASETGLNDSVITYKMDQPVLLFAFPSGQGDAYSSEASGSIKATPEKLGIPLDSLPINPDSLRIELDLRIESEFDQQGTVQTPAGETTALRQINKQMVTVKVFGYLNNFLYDGWINQSLFTRKDTVFQYNWYAKGMGIPVLSATVNDGRVKSIEYQQQFPLSVNASLAEILIDETPLENFQASATSYQVQVDKDAEEVPDVSAEAQGDNANVDIEQAVSLDGSVEERTAEILVTAESGHTKLYQITFTRDSLSANSKLAKIEVNDEVLEAFDPEVMHYRYDASGLDQVPEITAKPQDDDASVEIHPAYALSGDSVKTTTQITVKAEDGSKREYTVKFVKSSGFENTLAHKIKVYPNPVKNSLVVQQPGKSLFFRIMDLSGKVLFQKHISNQHNTLSVQELAPGTYIYAIVNSQGKLIKQGKLLVK